MSDASHTSTAEKDERAGRNPAGPVVAFDLDEEIRTATKELQSRDRGAVVLVKHRDLTVTLLALRKGARLHEHSAKGSVSVQVVAGVIRLLASGEEKTVSSGTICVLDREVPHAVEAMEDSTLLLTAALPPQ
jgi:quercetin dioxygenase-like cupin family protein